MTKYREEYREERDMQQQNESQDEIRIAYRQTYVPVDEGLVYAFIPGTIIDVFVKKGQMVKKGDALCSMHAMKMDNIICATISGKIKAVNVKEEQNISKNDVLVEIVPCEKKK
ncbi:MAG: acetyl-CoA carboxylase biotin carboxyl carrier protein subunit [Bacteroidales bacterium]|jgi:biotin carboxyl carrier protein|nr:acetyl-CoA carboxylase biotin carboxyl carrier protein subunit [Bacteroidales bacterium]